MDNLIDVFMDYKTNCLIDYGLLIYDKNNSFIKKVFKQYFKTYIDSYYYNIFHTVNNEEYSEEVLKKEFVGCMEEMLYNYQEKEIQVSNEEYDRNKKIIYELKDISYEISKIDKLVYKDKDDICEVVEKFIKDNSLLSKYIEDRTIKLVSLVKKYYGNINKILNYSDEYFTIKNRFFDKHNNYKYLELDFSIKLLNNYRIGLVRKSYNTKEFDYKKFELLMKKLAIEIIKNINNRNLLYFVEFKESFIYRGEIINKVYNLMSNPLIRKHVVFLIDYNTYLNHRNAFSLDCLFGCIQNFTHINDIYKKTDNICKEEIFKYLVVSDCKYKDRIFFNEYKNEKIEVLMFEEE